MNLNWKALKRVLAHKFFANLYVWLLIVPIFAKMLQGMPEVIRFPIQNSSPIEIDVGLPFSWYILYFSALSAYLAFGIYSIYCPKFLREHDNAGEALSSGSTLQRVLREQREFIETYYSKNYRATEKEHRALFDLFRQLRVHGVAFEVKFPNPDGKELADILLQVTLTTIDEGNTYIMSDGAQLQRDQLFKHCFGDLIALQEISFEKLRFAASYLIFTSAVLGLIVVAQGTYFVVALLLS